MLAVNVREQRHTVRKYVEGAKLPFPVLLDSKGEVAGGYGVTANPAHFIIDGKGRIVGVAIGARDWANREIKELFSFLLEENRKGR